MITVQVETLPKQCVISVRGDKVDVLDAREIVLTGVAKSGISVERPIPTKGQPGELIITVTSLDVESLAPALIEYLKIEGYKPEQK